VRGVVTAQGRRCRANWPLRLLLCLSLSSPAALADLPNGGIVSAAIAVPGEVDVYTFAANAGDGIQARAGETGEGLFAPRIVVRGPDGSEVVADTGTGAAGVQFQAAQGGSYTLTVADGTSGGQQTGSYDLHFVRAPGAAEGGTLANGGMVADTIDRGDLDSFRFFASAGQGVQLRVGDAGDGLFAPRLTLYGPDGSEVAASTGTGAAAVWHQAAASGSYTVVVADGTSGLAQAGDYELHFVRAPGAAEGGSLANGGMVSGDITVGDLDSYAFTASAGDSVQLRVGDTGDGLFAPRLTLYDPAGGQVTASTGTAVAGLWHRATVGGSYTVVVGDGTSGLAQAGQYDLHFVRAPGAAEGGELVDGDQVSASLSLGDLDSYAFVASRGERVAVTVTDTSGSSLAPRVTLYDPLGEPVRAATSTTEVSFPYDIEVDGMHTLVVADSTSGLAQTGAYRLAFTREIDLLSYAALGDSYSSGEGVRPYQGPGDTWLSGCHRSTRAYAQQVRVPGSAEPVAQRADAVFDFIACSGAVTDNLRAAGEGQHGEPPQLAAANAIDASRDLVTLSIGGNDAYFARIVAFCFAHEACNEIQPFAPHLDLELGELFPLVAALVKAKLLDVYAELKGKATTAAILVLEYPLVVGGSECAAARVPGADHLALSAAEQAWMRDANVQLNTVVREAAATRGLHFVATADHFDGHEVCGRYDDWIFGLRPLDPKASFHPTGRGQRELARLVNAYLESNRSGWPAGYFDTGLPRNPAPVASPAAGIGGPLATLDAVPEFGDLALSLPDAPATCSNAAGRIVPGETLRVQGQGYAPGDNVAVTLKLAGQPAMALGSGVADGAGTIDLSLAVPGGIDVGGQGVVQALGAGSHGHGRLLLAPVRVEASFALDSDGDGLADGCDNCPGVANPDQADADQDGSGDACDACPLELVNDEDGDGVCAALDPCPLDPDDDIDGDGVCAPQDNCAITPNPDQADDDGDGIGDACAALACHPLAVSVRDGALGEVQFPAGNCGNAGGYFSGTGVELVAEPRAAGVFTGWSGDRDSAATQLSVTIDGALAVTANFCSDATDSDGDRVADACDNCPALVNAAQADNDGDAAGDACDPDDDNDGLPDDYELARDFDPLTADDALADPDGDGEDTLTEYRNGTDPRDPRSNSGSTAAGILAPILPLLLQ
jgi:lysophospholipase L1-like esterase